jgi:hypothetical protein
MSGPVTAIDAAPAVADCSHPARHAWRRRRVVLCRPHEPRGRHREQRLTNWQTAEVLEKLLGCGEPGTQNDPKVPRDLALAGTENTYQGEEWSPWGNGTRFAPSLRNCGLPRNSNLDCWNQEHALPTCMPLMKPSRLL